MFVAMILSIFQILFVVFVNYYQIMALGYIAILVVLVAVYYKVLPHYLNADASVFQGKTLFDFSVDKPDSNDQVSLKEYHGKKAYLVVNVASQCGLTDKNYAGLQEIYEKYR